MATRTEADQYREVGLCPATLAGRRATRKQRAHPRDRWLSIPPSHQQSCVTALRALGGNSGCHPGRPYTWMYPQAAPASVAAGLCRFLAWFFSKRIRRLTSLDRGPTLLRRSGHRLSTCGADLPLARNVCGYWNCRGRPFPSRRTASVLRGALQRADRCVEAIPLGKQQCNYLFDWHERS
jgi:hypothetical protein